MTGTRADIARAEAEAAAAKLRLQATAERLKLRLNPAVRAHELWDDVRDKGVGLWSSTRDRGEVLADDAIELAYERPRAIAGVVGAIALLLLRRPIARLVLRVGQRRPKWDHTTATPRHSPAAPRATGRQGDRR